MADTAGVVVERGCIAGIVFVAVLAFDERRTLADHPEFDHTSPPLATICSASRPTSLQQISY